MKSYILLENVVFFAYHGVLPQETKVGNEYIVNLRIGVDLSKAAYSDQLDDTISYADIYADMKKEMEIPSKLLENVAYRIIRRLKEKYKMIESIEIKVAKRNPPMGAKLDCAAVVLKDEWNR